MARVARWLSSSQGEIDTLVVTLDTHHLLDIAHPDWWIDAYGGHPVPFSTITSEDLQKGRYTVASETFKEASFAYVDYLAAEGKKTLVIWPPHCLLGAPGHAIYEPIRQAIYDWEVARSKPVEYVLKGMNPLTEHYSAVRAEKVDPEDLATATNGRMIHVLDNHDRIIVAGEALSHCVADTVSDLMDQIRRDKFTLLEDGMSNVPGFESVGTRFLYRAKGRGVTVSETECL